MLWSPRQGPTVTIFVKKGKGLFELSHLLVSQLRSLCHIGWLLVRIGTSLVNAVTEVLSKASRALGIFSFAPNQRQGGGFRSSWDLLIPK